MTDEELVVSVRAGDTGSLGRLVARWERPLYRFVFRMLPRPEDAQDVCQETFLRILRKSHRFREGSRFSTWMYQIALNLCRDRMRRRRRWSLVLDESREIDDRVDAEQYVVAKQDINIATYCCHSLQRIGAKLGSRIALRRITNINQSVRKASSVCRSGLAVPISMPR